MKNDILSLENQLCFKLYTAEKEIMKIYRTLLADIGVTYPQYLTLLVLWKEQNISVKKLGEKLFLDSGTLTPMLKRMEVNGLITRKRSVEDERVVLIALTEKGESLQQEANCIPKQLVEKLMLNEQDLIQLNNILSTLVGKLH